MEETQNTQNEEIINVPVEAQVEAPVETPTEEVVASEASVEEVA